MNDDPVLLELEETRRELWAESDGTLAGYARMVDRIGQEYREEFLAEQSGKRPGNPDYAEAMCVREGDAPAYGETSDLARKGEKGE
jgi:hypothetical protein